MVWGAFSLDHRTPLFHVQGNLTGLRYRDEILRPLAVPTLQQMGPQAVYQDDNARPHRARVVNDFLQQSGVNRIEWPACSPDLDPIENLRDELDRKVRSNHPLPGMSSTSTRCCGLSGRRFHRGSSPPWSTL
ncbi:hypothetical protein V1264_016070 [Littorina saxatilis]|uniref:Tc1-like transposase DDE domain-containing protein n=1 Tax=Littorina saxatilis TaxID=31220 RepID=A0AAN9BL19_9CAEN